MSEKCHQDSSAAILLCTETFLLHNNLESLSYTILAVKYDYTIVDTRDKVNKQTKYKMVGLVTILIFTTIQLFYLFNLSSHPFLYKQTVALIFYFLIF